MPDNWLAKHLPPTPAPDATAVSPSSARASALDNFMKGLDGSAVPAVAAVASPLGAGMLAVEHYSPVAGLTTLDPSFAGSGKPGREQARADRIPAVHVYDSKAGGVEPEFAKSYRYTGEVPEDKVYDISSDDAGLVSAFRAKKGYLDPSEMEKMLKSKGYAGYRNTDASESIIKLFGNLPVKAADPVTRGGKTFGIPHPDVNAALDSVLSAGNKAVSVFEDKNIAKVLHALIKGGAGFTLDPATGKPVTKGYAVGAGDELGNALKVPAETLKPKHIAEWLAANKDKFQPGTAFGGWVDNDGIAYIEPSTIVNSLREAKKLGLSRGEKAIADLAKFAKGLNGEIRF